MEKLLRYLKSMPVGTISDTGELESLLISCWDQFKGDDGGMSGYKLHGRMEEVDWNPPILTFVIERHGITNLGSTKADLQHWKLNINTREAILEYTSYRQVQPRQAKLDVKSLAEEISRLIIDHREDERIKWYKDGSVLIHIGKILPKESAVQQTLVGRRKRFREHINKLLTSAGWQKVGPNRYAPSSIAKENK